MATFLSTRRFAIVAGAALAVICCASSAAQQAVPYRPQPAPAPAPADPALLAAAAAYVHEQLDRELDFTLEVVARDPDFAQLDFQPTRPGIGALVFMKREGARWIGVEMGIVIRCRDLAKAGFPPSVSTGCE